jgi:ParB family transcriptional regulator, chromosome partitioning protein
MPLIPLAQITRNPNQPREDFPEDHIKQLAASIKARGLLQPIRLRTIGVDQYQIVAGECRFRAHQLLGAETIRAEIVEIDEREMRLQAIIENLQRRDMNPIEEAKAYQSLLDRDYTSQQIVDELGLKSTAIVDQRVLLLRLAPEVQRLVASGDLPTTMAGGIARLPFNRQLEMVRAINSGKLTTSEQVKHACIALRDAELQLDAFGELPKASSIEIETLTLLERRIEQVVGLVLAGFKDGECVAAQRVNPQRLETMADQLVLVRKHVLQMEHDLRRVATQSELIQNIRSDNEDHQHSTAVGVADRKRASPDKEGHRKQNVVDKLSRARAGARVSEARS